ncbi:hypothetical protein M0E87_12340 [Corynebacterium sp. CCM 9185]|uniref:Uncharacterized protein n=1 Tax=Corynebacterium marambiense TaxID=2765364 RepID=A0ABS0W1W7_9CORY|nr:hypothetical protein [Corynebacterium marambiense]MBI9001587.1 hypothetical protein [Corynebacterium marambiense]MCK7664429.1 hypothetical protein [Corynebacterium marambiense]
MEVNFKFISPDGRIDFTDPGIVAICGPKSSKIVASALARDTALSFENDGMIYGIRDYVDSRVWKSRRDVENENSDIGYLARNETGPGSGNRFLSIAGIHAEGSAIIVEHLCNYKRIREIHKKTKGSLFSSVIGGTYQRNPLSIEFSQLLTLHIREESCDVTNEVAFVEEDNKS